MIYIFIGTLAICCICWSLLGFFKLLNYLIDTRDEWAAKDREAQYIHDNYDMLYAEAMRRAKMQSQPQTEGQS